VLQTAQDLRDVIAGFGVEPNAGDVLLTELQLGIDDLPHEVSNDEVYDDSFARHRAIHPTARLPANEKSISYGRRHMTLAQLVAWPN
jgi:hypothetical protein